MDINALPSRSKRDIVIIVLIIIHIFYGIAFFYNYSYYEANGAPPAVHGGDHTTKETLVNNHGQKQAQKDSTTLFYVNNDAVRDKDNAYITYVDNENYAQGVIALKKSLERTYTKYDLVVMVPPSLKSDVIIKLASVGCLVQTIQPVEIPAEVSVQLKRWAPAFTKFKIWDMFEYQKLIWLDSDMLVTKNIDHLFSYVDVNKPEIIYSTIDADANSCDYKPERLKLINSGLMVISPNAEIYQNLIDNMKVVARLQTMVNDQDVINYTLPWRALEYPSYGVQITHCECKDPKLWSGDQLEDIHVLHYTAGLKELPKPWDYFNLGKEVADPYSHKIPNCVRKLYKTWMENYTTKLLNE